MSAQTNIQTLISEIEKSRDVQRRISGFYGSYVGQLGDGPRGPEQAIVVADLLVSYYTCLETIFLRISQFFENNLDAERWHADLLDKMTLRIEGVREPVIEQGAQHALSELLKFRHFKRYYFDLDYDWDRIEFVQKKYDQAMPLVDENLQRFLAFLRELAQAEDE